ncbi:D-alanyl-D-alanine carboxypeptidase family protein [Streptomyces violascens]|uniref:D-alanyl-D-alanine carboxypeptidase n=1 Tax=Streptomyces violascens TaxID=67381 RepID=A0ABQ3R1V0_9ACTN|nr:serine hydrolase [Streptomyces violascens]GGU37268.1 D-alanyl-D-alanine carboxypeptidase [Streptomyces violascens]GHI43511.1 D-alanyl-D-alanine carboxypeptidase [Streptomyces violascens]
MSRLLERGWLAACRLGDAALAGAHRIGSTAALPWPQEGQASVELVGVGSLGTVGGQTPVPIASLTKVMTAYVVLRAYPLGPEDAGPMVRVDRAAAQESDSVIESVVPVEEGQRYPLRQLLEFMLIPSGNNIARLLARWSAGSEAAFVRRMNAAAAELGMTRSAFTGSCGMDVGNVGTAADLLTLAGAVMRDEVFRTIVSTPSVPLPGGQGEGRTTNRLLGQYGVVGLKTGTSTPAGGNVLWAAYTDVGGVRRLVLGAVLAQRTGRSPVRARAAVWAHTRRLVMAVQRMAPDGFALPQSSPAPPETLRGCGPAAGRWPVPGAPAPGPRTSSTGEPEYAGRSAAGRT